MLIQRLSSMHHVLRECQGWVDYPPSQPCMASIGTLDAWIFWRIHLVFWNWLDGERLAHSLVDRSLDHPYCKIRRKSYPKPPWETSIHWCEREGLEILRGTRIHSLHKSYSSTFICQHNELALSLSPFWVWRFFWSVATSPCPPSAGGSWKEWGGPLEEPFRMQRKGLRCYSKCSEGDWVACSECSEED